MQDHSLIQLANLELANFPLYDWERGSCKRAETFPETGPLPVGAVASFATVLKQPETKRKQTVFVEDLAVPPEQLVLTFADRDEEAGAVLSYKRPSAGVAYFLSVTAKSGCKARLYLLEDVKEAVADVKVAEAESGKPAVLVQAVVEPDAELEIICLHPLDFVDSTDLNRPPEEVTLLYKAQVEQGALFKWTSLNFTESIREKGLVTLTAAEATADIGHAAYVSPDRPHESLVNVHCRAPRCRALVRQHGVVADGGEGSFFSIADIDKGACGTFVREDNRILTLGSTARAFTDPVLLIREHDVAASHAATVGDLDPEILFYLCSRGLTEARAKELITVGYLMPLIDRLPEEGLRTALRSLLTERVGPVK